MNTPETYIFGHRKYVWENGTGSGLFYDPKIGDSWGGYGSNSFYMLKNEQHKCSGGQSNSFGVWVCDTNSGDGRSIYTKNYEINSIRYE